MGDPKAFQPFLEVMKFINVEQVVFLFLLAAQNNPAAPHRKLELTIEKLELPHVFLRLSFFLQNLSTTFSSATICLFLLRRLSGFPPVAGRVIRYLLAWVSTIEEFFAELLERGWLENS
jgi:uncharacterized protein YbjT (DUF2867 family)